MRTSSGGSARAAARSEGRVAEPGTDGFDWNRLDRAVRALVGQQDALREQVAHRDERIRRLEAQLLEANQRRQDTVKRVDDLISQLDALDEQLAGLEPGE